MDATMHRLAAAMLVSLLCCFLFIATLKAQQQPQQWRTQDFKLGYAQAPS